MAFKIGSECVTCGACEVQCPNQAIVEGPKRYAIRPERCTECVGSHEFSRCADVCAVGAPRQSDAKRETREALLARWNGLHPGKSPKGLILSGNGSKPVIALIADGSPDPVGQKTLEELDTLIRERFPGYDVCWAFMAKYMIEGLKRGKGQEYFFERGVPMWGATELLNGLALLGVKKVAMQLLMMHESSFSREAIGAPRHGIELQYALPFLSTPDNRKAIIEALRPDFGDGINTATVLVGHGVLKDFEQNNCFVEIDQYLRHNFRNTYLGTLHGPPGIESAAAEIKKSGCQKVRFISLMLTTSDHIAGDVMGDAPESWKSQVGLPAEAVDNLAQNPLVREFFIKSIKSVVDKF